MKTVLSTKKLSTAQQELLLNAGIGLVEYNALDIELVPIDLSENIKNGIFTSKNAVRAMLNLNIAYSSDDFKIQNTFCVGEKTKLFLETNGQKVLETAETAADLAKIISKKYKNEQFSFFCGNLRRDELPLILKNNSVRLKEYIVYRTHLNSKIFNRIFDGILFFSPSGVQSYVRTNRIGDSVVFCIGNTTASEAKKYTQTVCVANKATIENVIVQVVKYFKKNG
ncbi:uroporphyrinogen-III synthase [Aquimarina addita]|uniref:Uroporphyrinogen-III synthase n=1 Tax=Aquimarina addita TaxID=870485 RepID=A0ABP7XBP5_9FLAO